MTTKHPADALADTTHRHRNEAWNDKADDQLRRIPALEAERDDAIQQHAAALDLVSRIRFSLGDNGARMQDELIEWCKELADDAHDRNALMQRHNALSKNAAECRQERDALRAEVELLKQTLRLARGAVLAEREARKQAQIEREQAVEERNCAGIKARTDVTLAAFLSVRDKDEIAHRERMAQATEGACESCYGDGQIGGQFCGGFEACTTCNGTGRAARGKAG